jgi:hypothetical protein
MEEKDFDKIMLKSGSSAGLDPKKGEKTKKRTNVIGQIKENKERRDQVFPKAKKGDTGRIGEGRFNRQVQQEREMGTNSRGGRGGRGGRGDKGGRGGRGDKGGDRVGKKENLGPGYKSKPNFESFDRADNKSRPAFKANKASKSDKKTNFSKNKTTKQK